MHGNKGFKLIKLKLKKKHACLFVLRKTITGRCSVSQNNGRYKKNNQEKSNGIVFLRYLQSTLYDYRTRFCRKEQPSGFDCQNKYLHLKNFP